jgi:carbonic anhydrase/acetyltransferase-like protein (isoleucine patch superfamily)
MADMLYPRPAPHTLITFEGMTPHVHPSAFIAPTAVLIGNVEIGPETNIWFHCVLRGDVNFVRVGARCNIQDGTIIHVDHRTFPAIIGDDVTIGHAAIVHACTLKNRAFVAMGSTVLDGAVVEEGGMLGAGGLLAAGKTIGPNELWLGAPARFKRVLTPEDRASFDEIAPHYVRLGQRYRAGMRAPE